MTELAQQLIEREKRDRTGYLDLGNCALTELPDLDWLAKQDSYPTKTPKFA
jgi:hypothetical protein